MIGRVIARIAAAERKALQALLTDPHTGRPLSAREVEDRAVFAVVVVIIAACALVGLLAMGTGQ